MRTKSISEPVAAKEQKMESAIAKTTKGYRDRRGLKANAGEGEGERSVGQKTNHVHLLIVQDLRASAIEAAAGSMTLRKRLLPFWAGCNPDRDRRIFHVGEMMTAGDSALSLLGAFDGRRLAHR